MALILAIEPDRRQANQLHAMVRGRLKADLVLADSAERALAALGDRVPDLILTSALLSPKDETELGERLRALDGVAAHVQTLTIPVLAAPRPRPRNTRGVLSALRRDKPEAPVLDGCDPAVFAEQCAAYLDRAAAERAQLADAEDAESGDPGVVDKRTVVKQPVLAEPPAVEAQPVVVAPPVIEDPVFEPAPALHLEAAPVLHVEASAAIVDQEVPPFVVVDDDDEPKQEDENVIELDLTMLLDEAIVGEFSIPFIEPAPVGKAAEGVEAADAASEAADEPPAPPVKADAWIPARLGVSQLWPAIEGILAESPSMIVPPAVDTQAPGARRPTRGRRKKPVQDEWGFFDPEQCGFAALLEKLKEITDTIDDGPTERPA